MKIEQANSSIILNWYKLKFLPNNRLIKSMGFWFIFVPIGAKILSQLKNPLVIEFSKYVLKLDLTLPFSWYAFFFSALFFTIGNILFSLWCPEIIKDHLTFSGFLNDGKLIQHLEVYANEISLDFDNLKYSLNYDPSGSPNIELKKIFWEIYEKAKSYPPIKRILCAVAYYIGFGFAFYVIVGNIYWVMKSYFS